MAKTGAFRWRGWPSNHSKRNPDGNQRDCTKCKRPFVPYSDWNTRCPQCTAAARGSEGPAGREKARRARALAATAPPKTPASASKAKVKGPAKRKPAAAPSAKPVKVKPPKKAKSHSLATVVWPPSAWSRQTPMSATSASEVLVVSWGPRTGEVTLRVYDANGERVGYIRRPAASRRQNFRKLSSASQPLTVLLTVAEGNEPPNRHARASVRIR